MFWNIVLLAFVFLLYYLLLIIYRLFLHPLSRFPGPRIAAFSFAYQFYHDILRRGQYIYVIQRLHAQYGPIIRINPHELHIQDSSFYDNLYSASSISRKRDKWSWDTLGAAGVQDSTLSTIDHDLHRTRRSAIAPFFSALNVRKLEPVIQERVDVLFERLMESRGEGVINLSHAFSAFTNDVIMEYSFARSFHRLEAPDFDPSYKNSSRRGVRMAQIAKHLRFLTGIVKVLLWLPEAIAERMGPTLRMFIIERRRLLAEIESLKSTSPVDKPTHRTVFRELLSSSLPTNEKAPMRLAADAQVLVSAGSETSARALTYATYALLTHPHILVNLKKELHDALPNMKPSDTIPLSLIQTLPYLSAVIRESLRLSYGVVGRLARVFPSETIQYGNWSIPPGTPVSMTSYDVHHDEDIFPDSHEFRPERWLDSPGLERYLVSFGKGSRQCLGMNLAYAEMYVVLGRVFRWYGGAGESGNGDVGTLELWETDESDVKMVAEVLVPFTREGSKGVRARVGPLER